jgi:hypothetical protein
VVIFFISRKSSAKGHPSSGVKPSISTTAPTISVHGRPDPLAAVAAALPSVRSKRRAPPPLPMRRKGSKTTSQTESRGMPTLSAIGDFAVTRDDVGQYTTVGSIPHREALSRASHRRGEGGSTRIVVSSLESPTSEDETPFGSRYQSSNMMQMMPTLKKDGSFTPSTSLEELKEEEIDSPAKSKRTHSEEKHTNA